MLLLLMLELFSLRNIARYRCITLLDGLLPLFHQLDSKREAEYNTDNVIEPDEEPARFDVLVRIFLPAIVMTQLVVCNLFDDFCVFGGFYFAGQSLVDLMLCNLCLLEIQNLSLDMFRKLHAILRVSLRLFYRL